MPKFASQQNIAMWFKYKPCENSITAGCFLCTSVIFPSYCWSQNKDIEDHSWKDGSFYAVSVCRRIDDIYFSRRTVSKSKFNSCSIKSTRFEASFKILVKKHLLRLISFCFFYFGTSSVRFWVDEPTKNWQTTQILLSSNISCKVKF